MTTLTLPNPRLGIATGTPNRGVSEVAQDLADRWLRLFVEQREPMSQGEGVREALGELEDIVTECSEHGWDGYDGEPVDRLSVSEASRFLLALPANIPAPQVSVDPDGEVSMDWEGTPDTLFSVSIRGDGRLSYAGRFGIRRARGTEYLSDEIPRQVMDHVRRALS